MNTTAKPMRTTLVFGMCCGLLAFFPTGAARWTSFSYVLFQGLIWTCLAVYGILLARWSETPFSRVVFPLALPLPLLLFHSPPQAFFLFCLLILSWVRSGTCFPNTLAAGLATELALCFGAAALVAFFSPRSALSWGLGIWLFLPGAVPVFPDPSAAGNDLRGEPRRRSLRTSPQERRGNSRRRKLRRLARSRFPHPGEDPVTPAGRGHHQVVFGLPDLIEKGEETRRPIPSHPRRQLMAPYVQRRKAGKRQARQPVEHERLSRLFCDKAMVFRLRAVIGAQKIRIAHIYVPRFSEHGVRKKFPHGFGQGDSPNFLRPQLFQTPLRSQMNRNGRDDPVQSTPRKQVFMKKGDTVSGDGFAIGLPRQLHFSRGRVHKRKTPNRLSPGKAFESDSAEAAGPDDPDGFVRHGLAMLLCNPFSEI